MLTEIRYTGYSEKLATILNAHHYGLINGTTVCGNLRSSQPN